MTCISPALASPASFLSALTNKRALALCALLLAGACSSGDDGPVDPARQGRFLDSAVHGLSYTTATRSGVTDSDGTFDYVAGESIVFSIGDVRLPEVPAATIITPLQIFGDSDESTNAVANLARLLQSLDLDGNAENGIEIGADAALSATGLELDFSSADFDTQAANLVANSGSVISTLITADSAMAHLNETLADNGFATSGCGSDHRFVGRTAEFDTQFHDVAGTLEVIDNCTLEIRSFDYDGQGPQVFFYAGLARDYSNENAFRLGPQLDGTVWNNDSLRVSLPNDRTLDEFDSISVWCFDFFINFGDAFFGDA